MSENNLDAIQRELELRKVRRDGAQLLKGRELYDFQTIREKHDHQRTETERLYQAEYKIRTDVAYQMLLRKTGSPKPVLKPRFFGADQFSTRKLNQNAQRLVRFQHEQTMARLDKSELTECSSFLDKCSERKRYVEQFKASSDRRRTQLRRQGSERRNTPTISD